MKARSEDMDTDAAFAEFAEQCVREQHLGLWVSTPETTLRTMVQRDYPMLRKGYAGFVDAHTALSGRPGRPSMPVSRAEMIVVQGMLDQDDQSPVERHTIMCVLFHRAEGAMRAENLAPDDVAAVQVVITGRLTGGNPRISLAWMPPARSHGA